MGFRAEFNKMRSQGGSPKLTQEIEKEVMEVAKAKDAELTDVGDPDTAELPNPFVDGAAIDNPTVQVESPLPDKIPAPVETKKVPIKINGKTFDSVEDAMEYAAQVERDLEKQEAFNKGLQANKAPEAPKPAEIKKIKKIADKFFEDPEAAMEELEAHMEERAQKLFESREAAKDAAKTQAENIKNTWDNFYKTNADLAEWQNEVDIVFQRERGRLENVKADVALAEIADLTRKYVASVKERALPKTTLPPRTVVSPQGGGKAATATTTPATEKKVSFASQVRSTNKRTVLQDED